MRDTPWGAATFVLVEFDMVEQRYTALLEVLLDGAAVSEVALRFGVTRQTVHRWLRRCAWRGLSWLADRSPQYRRVAVQPASNSHRPTSTAPRARSKDGSLDQAALMA